MLVAELGEFGLIDRLARLVDRKNKTSHEKQLLIGIGDDAAAWKCRGTELITTDILVEGVHFSFDYMSWRDLGWKAIAINVSDIYAMGGRPRLALASLAMPGSCRVDDVLAMYEGMIEACNCYDVSLAGGNVSAAGEVVINVALTGVADENIMTRHDARAGDLIGLFGYPGLSAAGLKALTSHKKIGEADMKLLGRAHLHPVPPVDSGFKLAACGVKAAVDTSDGLLADLGHICEGSGKEAVLYIQNLPVHRVLKRYFKQECIELALTGGEDYQLLFTAPEETMDTVIKSMKPAPSIIGEILAGKAGRITVLDEKGKAIAFNRKGWDHYTRQNNRG